MIPFDYRQGFLWIQVRIPQSPWPLHFIFDTGAGVSVINAGTARALGLKAGNRIAVQAVHATLTGHWPVRLAANAGGVALPSEYLALDLSRLARACGRPLDGLLGADFLQGRAVQIDFDSGQLRFPGAVCAAKSDAVIPLKICHGGGCLDVPVSVNHRKPQWMRLDTGCATALQWVTADPSTPTATAKTAVALTEFSIPQTETTVAMGGIHFERVATGIHRQPIFPGESGLLGNGLLDRFKTVTLDFKARRLILGDRRSPD
ncbi:MAG: aspartyl protease family protein [Verrucomicrobiota bacterium]|nr:aspartyl protease family protein [Verrucomicrobiota bacterium]